MSPDQIKVLVQSRNPINRSTLHYQLMYGEEFGGWIDPKVRIKGDVYLPMTSWASGKCELEDVKLPTNLCIISLSIHSGQNVSSIGDFKLVKDLRIRRGVYASGLLRIDDHQELNAKVIIGYELRIHGRNKTSDKTYKDIQKKKKSAQVA